MTSGNTGVHGITFLESYNTYIPGTIYIKLIGQSKVCIDTNRFLGPERLNMHIFLLFCFIMLLNTSHAY